jgi:hypothetical protein
MVEVVKAVVEAVVAKEPAEEVVVVVAATSEVLVTVVESVDVVVKGRPSSSHWNPIMQHASSPFSPIVQALSAGQPRCF